MRATATLSPPPAVETATVRRRAVFGGVFILAARLAAQGFQWAVTLFVARLLLPDDYGMMTTGTLFVGLADLMAEAGVGRALVQKKDLTRADLAQGFTLSLLLSVGLYAVLALIAWPAAGYLERPGFALFLQVLALPLFLVPIRATAGALLERDLRLGKSALVQLVGAAAQAALVLGFALAGWGYWALAAGVLAGRFLEAAAFWRASGWLPEFAWPSHEASGLLRFGIHISAGGLLWFIYSNADFAVLGALLGPVALGYYAVAFQLISLPVQKISAAANQVMFAVYCKMQDDRDRQRDWFLRLLVLQDAIAFPALIGLALVADDALPLLLGERWLPAVLPLQLLCPVGVLMMIGYAVPPLLNARGRPDINLRYTAVSAILYPAGFLLGASWGEHMFGNEGALIAVCVVWLVLYPLLVTTLLHLTRHLTGVTPIAILRAHGVVLGGVILMSLAVLAIEGLLATAPTAARLGASMAMGGAVYAGWMLLAGRSTIVADFRAVARELRGRRGAAT